MNQYGHISELQNEFNKIVAWEIDSDPRLDIMNIAANLAAWLARSYSERDNGEFTGIELQKLFAQHVSENNANDLAQELITKFEPKEQHRQLIAIQIILNLIIDEKDTETINAIKDRVGDKYKKVSLDHSIDRTARSLREHLKLNPRNLPETDANLLKVWKISSSNLVVAKAIISLI